jgi:hypothetical protein
VSRRALGGVAMIGGRNFEPTQRPHLTLTFAGAVRDDVVLPPGPFLRFISLPFVDADRPTDYIKVSVGASPVSRIAIEQFDASAARPLVGFGDGWHEQEFNPRTGARWRWLSERGELQPARHVDEVAACTRVPARRDGAGPADGHDHDPLVFAEAELALGHERVRADPGPDHINRIDEVHPKNKINDRLGRAGCNKERPAQMPTAKESRKGNASFNRVNRFHGRPLHCSRRALSFNPEQFRRPLPAPPCRSP